jgi:hypothetical protein
MNRREIITLRPPWPLAARAQQLTMPVIGFLSSLTPRYAPHIMPTYTVGLKRWAISRAVT